MWQQIALNKRNSCILLTIMLLVLLSVGASFGILTSYFLCIDDNVSIVQIIHSAQNGILIALIVWIILFLVAVTNGKNAILALNQAYKLPKESHRILENVVEEMSIAAGMPKPPEI